MICNLFSQAKSSNIGQCPPRIEVVGPPTEHLEPSEGVNVDVKPDIQRILMQHSYAHPGTQSTIGLDEIKTDIPKEEPSDGDKGDMFYASFDDEDSDCVTVEVPTEEPVVEDVKPLTVDTDFLSLTENGVGVTLEGDMQLLSPLSLSPQSINDNLLSVSPSHTDLGYESLSSPLSEPDSMDLSDFWCESLSELFPGLA